MSLFHFSKPPKRDVRFNMMMSAEEKADLEALAERDGLSASDLIRIAVNEYASRKKCTKKKKAKKT